MTNKLKIVVGLVVLVFSVSLVGLILAGGIVTIPKITAEEKLGAIEMESGKITADQLARSVLQRKTVYVSGDKIASMSNDENGVELLPSLGEGWVQEVVSIVGFNHFASEAWDRNSKESFEVKWDSGTLASGGNNRVALGASFSQGFLTRGTTSSTASKSIETWYPYNPSTFTENTTGRQRTASSSAVVLTGDIDPANVEVGYARTYNMTDFVFEVIYRVFPNYK